MFDVQQDCRMADAPLPIVDLDAPCYIVHRLLAVLRYRFVETKLPRITTTETAWQLVRLCDEWRIDLAAIRKYLVLSLMRHRRRWGRQTPPNARNLYVLAWKLGVVEEAKYYSRSLLREELVDPMVEAAYHALPGGREALAGLWELRHKRAAQIVGVIDKTPWQLFRCVKHRYFTPEEMRRMHAEVLWALSKPGITPFLTMLETLESIEFLKCPPVFYWRGRCYLLEDKRLIRELPEVRPGLPLARCSFQGACGTRLEGSSNECMIALMVGLGDWMSWSISW